MSYYVSKAFWLLAAPTRALVLISASAAVWVVLSNSQCAAWLATTAACGLVIGAFSPIGLALTVPLEKRFSFSRPDPYVPPDGIIMRPGGADRINAVSTLSQEYPKARLTLCGVRAVDNGAIKRLADLGVDPARVNVEPQSRTTSEDALCSAALLKPKANEKWLLVTAAMHMPRAVGCFRAAGFQVEPYPVGFVTRGRSGPFPRSPLARQP